MIGGTYFVMVTSDTPMTPVDALGVACAASVRFAVSFGAGAAIAGHYQYLFMQFDDYDSDEYKVRNE
jgi:hypothetical protein